MQVSYKYYILQNLIEVPIPTLLHSLNFMTSWCGYYDIMSSVEFVADLAVVTSRVAESLAARRGSNPQGSSAVMSMRARASSVSLMITSMRTIKVTSVLHAVSSRCGKRGENDLGRERNALLNYNTFL